MRWHHRNEKKSRSFFILGSFFVGCVALVVRLGRPLPAQPLAFYIFILLIDLAALLLWSINSQDTRDTTFGVFLHLFLLPTPT